MNILDRTLARFGYAKASQNLQTPGWLRASAEAERFSVFDDSAAGYSAIYTKLSWVQIAVSAVAQSAAVVPMQIKQLQNEQTEAIVNHPFETLMRRPNPLQSRFEFLEAHHSYKLISGNSYWYLSRTSENAPPTELWMIPPHQIVPVPDGRSFIRGYLYDTGQGGKIPLEPWEVCHFKTFNPLNKFLGLSPMQALMISANADIAAQRFSSNFYSKHNAKIAGILAFADPINDSDWKAMRVDMEREHGDGKNRIMRLRNSGKGGVEWISTQLTQAEMQYLEQRAFTKEEILALYAPGLAASIDPNANEASGRTGDMVLNARAIYPALVATDEKITNDILPAYGDNLICESDDPRHKDRALELQEQQSAASVMTIDEIRQRFWNAPPLPDGRGATLVGESAASATTSDASGAQQPTKDILGYHIEQGVVSRNEARANLGLPAEDESKSELLRSLTAKLTVVKTAIDTGIPLVVALQLVDMQVALPDTPPEPTPPPQLMDMQMSDAPTKADLARWERKSIKRLQEGKSAAVGFDSTAIDPETADAITHALTHAGSVEAIKAAFKRNAGDALTPDEQAIYDAILPILQRSQSDTAKRIMRGETVALNELDAQLRAALLPALAEVATERAFALASEIGLTFDESGSQITAWAGRYTAERVKGMTDYTRAVIERVVTQFRATPGMTLGDVARLLQPAFSARRADLIAVTEHTRAANQAAQYYQRYLSDNGLVFERVNQTNNDERVCPICGPLDGKRESDWPSPDGAPWHPGCRCSTSLTRVKP